MLGWAVMCSSRGCLSLWKRIRLWVCGNVQLEERRYPWGEGGWELEENRGLLFLCGVLVLDQTLEQTWKNSSSTPLQGLLWEAPRILCEARAHLLRHTCMHVQTTQYLCTCTRDCVHVHIHVHTHAYLHTCTYMH